jgi:tryptophanyl-tRNA synthetase
VPVGKDQKQHLEITRDLANAFNLEYGEEVLKLPRSHILQEVAVVPGVDGQKMSKSYGNTLEIFAPESELKKRVMSIVTDSTPVAEPKPEQGALYELLKILTPRDGWPEVRRKFTEGGTGYGDLKKRLLGLLLDGFAEPRARRAEIAKDPGFVETVLRQGRERARPAIDKVMAGCRRVSGVGA